MAPMFPEAGKDSNESNVSPNTYYHILRFLEGQSEEWTPSTLAKELKMSPGTVRWALSKLRKQGKVIYRKVGKYRFYAANKRFSDEFTRLFKQYGTDQLYQIHGLTLKRMGDFSSKIPQGGVDRWSFDYFSGKVSFQLSRFTLMVYGSFSDCPLDYDRFLLFLSCVDGHLSARDLPHILDDMANWWVVQYGLNRDWKRFRNDSPTECVSVQGFSQWFARVYDKKPFGVLREEIHSREEKSLEKFIALVDGSLTSVQVMNFLDVLSRNINSLQASNFELARRVAQLADKVNSLLSINS